MWSQLGRKYGFEACNFRKIRNITLETAMAIYATAHCGIVSLYLHMPSEILCSSMATNKVNPLSYNSAL